MIHSIAMHSIKRWITGAALLLQLPVFAQTEKGNGNGSLLNALILPVLIATIGYIVKSVYDILIERQKRKRSLIEDKLKLFYWPILTRLEQNTSIWKLILKKRSDRNMLEEKIGLYIEENIILKNHREIMDVIIANRYLAKFDEDLSNTLNKYFRHVAIYEGILSAKENIFPGTVGAPYPTEFDDIITQRTVQLQKQLDKRTWI
jgi:hypothetical protein